MKKTIRQEEEEEKSLNDVSKNQLLSSKNKISRMQNKRQKLARDILLSKVYSGVNLGQNESLPVANKQVLASST